MTECHRNAPMPVDRNPRWPVVGGAGWCGQYAPALPSYLFVALESERMAELTDEQLSMAAELVESGQSTPAFARLVAELQASRSAKLATAQVDPTYSEPQTDGQPEPQAAFARLAEETLEAAELGDGQPEPQAGGQPDGHPDPAFARLAEETLEAAELGEGDR